MSNSDILDYEQFEKDWKKRHKASLPRKVKVSSLSAFGWILFWLIVSIGAAIFSGTHTIPAAEMTIEESNPYRSQLAVTAFVIVEFVIFGAAAKRHEIKWLLIILICSLSVALIGNISSSYTAVTHNGGNILNQLSGILLSVIAPVTALAAGEVLHLQLTALALKQKEADELFQAQWKELDAKINSAYTKYEKEQRTDKMVMSNMSVSERTDSGQKSGYGFNRRTDAKDTVIQHLKDNPKDIDKSVRELAEVLGVGKTTVSDAKRLFNEFSTNGHSEKSAFHEIG